MANLNLKFLRGLQASLPTTGTDGYFYLTTDTHRLYTSIDGKVVPVNEGVTTVENLDALTSITDAEAGDFFYCTEENILTVFNGQNFVQINPDTGATSVEVIGEGNAVTSASYDAATRKLTLTKGETFATKSELEAIHSHDNKSVLDGITAEKVAAWDASEQNAKDYADDLDEAMNARVEALEAIDHEHANKALLDTYTQTEANLADAVAKKHEHANAAELAKIADGDKAKWDAVAADYLTSADKTTLENSIKEAKKAGTDANTNIETYKVANDARVLAIEEDVAEITDGTNGILAQAKSYTDGKDSAMNTRVAALETAAPTHALKTEVEAVDAKFANYNTTVAQKAIDDAQDAEIAKKVNKTDYEADKATFAIAETVNAALDLKANAADVVANTTFEEFKTANTQAIADAKAGAVSEVEAKGYAVATEVAETYATKTELGNVDAKFANYVTSASYAEDKASIEKSIEDEVKALAEVDAGFEARIADLEANFGDGEGTVEAQIAAAVAAEAEIARAAEKANADDIDALEGRMDTAEGKITDLEAASATHAIKTEVEAALELKADKSVVDAMYTNEQIDAAILVETNRAKGVEESLQTQINTIMNNPDAEGAINSINEFTQYVKDHGTIAEGMRTDINKNKEDIAANAKAIADQATSDAATYETKTDAAQKLTDAKAYTDAEVAKDRERLATLEAIDHDAYVDADATLKAELQAEIDADVKVVNDALEAYKTSNDAEVAKKANADAVYTKAEVEALIATAHQWGEF